MDKGGKRYNCDYIDHTAEPKVGIPSQAKKGEMGGSGVEGQVPGEDRPFEGRRARQREDNA